MKASKLLYHAHHKLLDSRRVLACEDAAIAPFAIWFSFSRAHMPVAQLQESKTPGSPHWRWPVWIELSVSSR
eukprot:6165693-Amphidinium_carterae.1